MGLKAKLDEISDSTSAALSELFTLSELSDAVELALLQVRDFIAMNPEVNGNLVKFSDKNLSIAHSVLYAQRQIANNAVGLLEKVEAAEIELRRTLLVAIETVMPEEVAARAAAA